MTTHLQIKALRNICFKISKFGSNTEQYRILRQAVLETTVEHKHLIPDLILGCETTGSVRAHLSEMFPNVEQGFAYRNRQNFLEQEFAELIYWSEREAMSPVEARSIQWVDCSNRDSTDHLLRMMQDCAETDPRHSLILSKHAVLDAVFYLLASNDVHPNWKSNIKGSVEQVVHMAEHPPAKHDIRFSPDKSFVTAVMPVIEYIDKKTRYYSWEESNRRPDYPTVQAAIDLCHAAGFLCRIVWRWIADDNDWPPSEADPTDGDIMEEDSG